MKKIKLIGYDSNLEMVTTIVSKEVFDKKVEEFLKETNGLWCPPGHCNSAEEEAAYSLLPSADNRKIIDIKEIDS
jgi:hypothetical protein